MNNFPVLSAGVKMVRRLLFQWLKPVLFQLSSTDEKRTHCETDSASRGEVCPLVSVVVTCFNYGHLLRECISSVAAQNYPNIEVIIVNDGSSDNTSSVAEACRTEFANVAIRIISQANSGQPAIARNVGIRSAMGVYVLPLDADDRISPEYISKAASLLSADSATDIIFADSLYLRDGVATRNPGGPFNLKTLTRHNTLVYCCLYRRTLWERVGGYRENIRGYEDWDFWVASALAGAKARHLADIGLQYTDKDGGVYSQTTKHHDRRVAQLRLNNQGAFRPFEIEQARHILANHK